MPEVYGDPLLPDEAALLSPEEVAAYDRVRLGGLAASIGDMALVLAAGARLEALQAALRRRRRGGQGFR